MNDGELSAAELEAAAAGDVNVLAALMLAGSIGFAAINLWIGTFGWLAAGLSVSATLIWSVGLWRRSPTVAAFVKIGFGVSGLAAPAFAIGGIVLGIVGVAWGWALLAAAVVYFFFSVLGLEILARAEQHGVLDPIAD